MRTFIIASITIVLLAAPVSSQPVVQRPALKFLAVSGGPAMTAEPDYEALYGSWFSAEIGLSKGERWGYVIKTGMVYSAPTNFSDYWYRYRGFFGLSLGAGPRYDFGIFDAWLLAGGTLARYDHSYSYFWFPYIEPGASFPVTEFGKRLLLEAGASMPLYFRADSFTAGLRVTATIVLEPPVADSYKVQVLK